MNTYIAECGMKETLCCEVVCRTEDGEQRVDLRVKAVKRAEDNPATGKVRKLMKQGLLSPSMSQLPDEGIHWLEPSRWIDIEEVDEYDDVRRCLYMWWGDGVDGTSKKYLYIGIVGDIRGEKRAEGGASSRNLAQRLKEEMKQFAQENIQPRQFRYDALRSSDYEDVGELLKTAEMRTITAFTAMFPCENAQDQIAPLVPECNVILLNKNTSYHVV